MSTGTIVLNIETPDLNLTGSGEFDVSSYLQDLFLKNGDMKELVSDKLSAIFKQVKTKDIAENWSDKIKKAFKIKSVELDIKKETSDHIKKLLKDLKLENVISFDKIQPIINKTNKTTGTPIDTPKLPSNLEKVFANFTTKLTDVIKKIDVVASKNNSVNANTDTVFGQEMDVVLVDFSDKFSDKLVGVLLSTLGLVGLASKSKDKEEKGGEANSGMFDKILKGVFGKGLPAGAASMLGKMAGGALLAGGLLWMAVDGIRGWMKSDEWGASKISSALGGALGGMSSGMDGALKNAGKGALIGAGIGTLIGGPLGLVIGALIGAALGGILGYIGGKNLAKGFDTFGAWWDKHITVGLFGGMENIKKKFEAIGKWITTNVVPFVTNLGKDALGWLENTLLPMIKNLGAALKPVFNAVLWLGEKVLWPIAKWAINFSWEWVKTTIGKAFKSITFLINWFVAIGEQIGVVMSDIVDGWNWFKDKFIKFGEWIGKSASDLVDWFVGKWTSIKNGFIAFGEAIGEGLFIIVNWIKEKVIAIGTTIKNGFIAMFDFIVALPTNIYNFVKTASTMAFNAVKAGFNLVFDTVSNIGTTIYNWLADTITSTIEKTKEGFMKVFDWISNLGTMLLDKAKSWFSSKKEETGTSKTEEGKAKAGTVTAKAQDIVIDFKKSHVQIQPDSSDKFYPVEDGGVFAKNDGGIDKQLKSINNVMIDLQKTTEKNLVNLVTVLNNHTEIFIKLLGVETDQLHMLPALASTKGGEQKESFPTTDVRDPIYEYRNNVYKNMRA